MNTDPSRFVTALARTPTEYSLLRDLIVEYEVSLPEDLQHPEPGGELQRLEVRYARPSAAFIATAGGAPAGCVVLKALDGSTAIVQRLYVRPEYRSLGIARALLVELIRHARELCYSRIVLDTDAERMAQAVKLYRSFGFSECSPYGDVGYAHPTYMELHLS